MLYMFDILNYNCKYYFFLLICSIRISFFPLLVVTLTKKVVMHIFTITQKGYDYFVNNERTC